MNGELLIKDFTYDLPDERIAKYPLVNRDESKLLLYRDGKINQSVYKNLADFLPHNTLLIFNNTKVVEVRLLFTKSTGSTIELFCLEPADEYKDISSAMLQKGIVRWKCLVGGAKKWKEEFLISRIKNNDHDIVLSAKRLQKLSDSFIIEFVWNDENISFAEILHLFGNIPLPPYLNRSAEENDKERYQTVYAKWDGSVAAPTAGLHFTDDVFAKLIQKGVSKDFVTLHVGAGTFKPVKSETVSAHEMHSEFIEVPDSLIKNLVANLSNPVIAVGTTSLRTIESLYWLGVKTILDENSKEDDLFLSQWEVYDLPQNIAALQALESLLQWMKKDDCKS